MITVITPSYTITLFYIIFLSKQLTLIQITDENNNETTEAQRYISLGCYRGKGVPVDKSVIGTEQNVTETCYEKASKYKVPYFSIHGRICLTYKEFDDACRIEKGKGSPYELFTVLTHGSWNKWTEWTQCSTTCQGGEKKKFRFCDNPPPSKFGLRCKADNNSARLSYEIKTASCNNNIKCSCKVRHLGRSFKLSDVGCCHLPFTYKGGRYKKCTKKHGQLLWCATSDKYGKVSGNEDWGYCETRKNETWERWNEWSVCSSFCKSGKRMRYRQCKQSTDLKNLGVYQCIRQHNVSFYDEAEEICNKTMKYRTQCTSQCRIIHRTSNIPMNIIIGGAIGLCLILTILIACIYRMKRAANKSGEVPSNNYADVTEIRSVPSQEELEYAELGPGGGRIGTRYKPEESNYAQVKMDGVAYPSLRTLPCKGDEDNKSSTQYGIYDTVRLIEQ